MPLPSVWDLVLIAVVSLQVAAVAYVHAARWKAMLLCLPFPFTFVALGLGRPIDVTNLLGLATFFLYVHAVRLLHQQLRVPIVPAIGASLAGYCLIGWVAAPLLPSGPVSFWTTAVLLAAGALFLHRRLPSRPEPGHRTPLPVWLKLPAIVAVVCLLLVVKEGLRGFATLFPMVTVVGAYETRHSLWTLSRQIPVLMLTMIPMMAVVRLAQNPLGMAGALALGWCAFLVVLVPLARDMWRRNGVP